MSINHISTIIMGLLLSPVALAVLPAEVIGTCKNQEAVRPSVIFSALPSPIGMQDDNVETGCVDHFEKHLIISPTGL